MLGYCVEYPPKHIEDKRRRIVVQFDEEHLEVQRDVRLGENATWPRPLEDPP